MIKDSSGVAIIFNPDVPSHLQEIETWYSMFISSQGLQDKQCLLMAHHKPGSTVEDGRLPLGISPAGLQKPSFWVIITFSGLTCSFFWRSLAFGPTGARSLQPGGGARGREASFLQILGKCCKHNVGKSRARGDVHHYIAAESVKYARIHSCWHL